MLQSCSASRLGEQLETLATFNGRPQEPGITRILFTPEEMDARNYVKGLMEQAGMTVTEDAIGNIYGTLVGQDPTLAPVWSGSHIDTVLQAGRYDGTAGVVAAIEACRCIKASGAAHRRSITALVFTSEEPTRFGTGCIGSRAMAGHLSLEETKALQDDQGVTLYSELERLGYTQKPYDAVRKHPGDVYAGVELHIEQAPVLDRAGIPIGLVEGICAPTYIHVTLNGVQGHAGSTPMCDRKDVMPAAAAVILELESLARAYGNTHTVATVGKLNAVPNASNVIAGKVSFTIDIRDIHEDAKQEITRRICRYIDTVADLRGLEAHYSVDTDDLPCTCNPAILDLMEQVCADLKIPCRRMTSGAYHDALLVASFAPVAMIFVPSKDGISHDPAEYTAIEDIARGADVLANTLLALANREAPL